MCADSGEVKRGRDSSSNLLTSTKEGLIPNESGGLLRLGDVRAIKKNAHKFWERVRVGSPNECHEWKSYIGRDGYGRFQFGYQGEKYRYRANRAAWILEHGEAIEAWEVIMHTCDNRCCVNHEHLRKGTHADNVADKVEKGRQAKGEANGRAKMTRSDVTEIREDMSEYIVLKAEELDVTEKAVRQVVKGELWRFLDAPSGRVK